MSNQLVFFSSLLTFFNRFDAFRQLHELQDGRMENDGRCVREFTLAGV